MADFSTITKPRVQYCRLTMAWVVNYGGWKHTCGGSPSPDEEAFRGKGARERAIASAVDQFKVRAAVIVERNREMEKWRARRG